MIGRTAFVVALWIAVSIGAPPVSARPVASVAPRIEQVRIASDPGVVLAGELQLPPADTRRPPVVLLLGGGGPSPHGIYPLLEKRLLARGIATLSFDKRGIGKSTGMFVDAMDVAQRDAAAVLAYLRSRQDVIDPARIAVLGVSQGGVIGPALAVDGPPIAAVVTMSAPAGQRGVLFLDEMREKLATSGMKDDAIPPILDATRRYLGGLTTAAPPESITADRIAVGEAFMAAGWSREQADGAVRTLGDPATSSLYTVAAGDVLARVKAPVLAVFAADDTVVSSRLAMPAAQVALRGNADATIVQMPGVEHAYKPLVTTAAGKREYQGWPISDPATIDLIDRWLTSRLSPGKTSPQ